MCYQYTFTIFTPTYNRAHTLPRVYASLQAQTFRDFEWLIIDDGSTDDTKTLVQQWQQEAPFPINYVWKENGGKHTAVNVGVQAARGEFFLFLDSDDGCVPQALERLKYHWDAIPCQEKERFSAVTALAQSVEGKILGDRFPFDPTDSDSLEIKLKYKVTGEKWGFQRTDVLKEFPYPVYPGETTMPESLLWHRIARKYKTRYVNEPLEIYYLTPNGWGANSHIVRARSAKSTRLYFTEYVNMDYPIPRLPLLRAYANYVRFSCHDRVGFMRQLREIRAPHYWLLALPVGLAAFFRDKLLLWRSR